MSQTEKQQTFRQKLQDEGADSFADGPRPWEQWDESGNQNDNRIWEGTARRLYPKQKAARGFGDRLLSGLAMIALASLLVGIAGVYFSTPVTMQQARTMIQPPPIATSRIPAPPATWQAGSAGTVAPELASLDILSPPAAGIPALPKRHKIVLEPAVTASRTAPIAQSGNIDKVAVETVITQETVTTTVYTQQPSQYEPELVATIATTTPFTQESTPGSEPPLAPATATAFPEQTDVSATAPVIVAPAAKITEPAVAEWTEDTANEPADEGQAVAAVTEPIIIALAETTAVEPALEEQAATAVTEPTIVAQVETTATEPAVEEQAATTVTEPTIVAQVETTAVEPAVEEQAAAAVTEPTIIAQAETTAVEPAVEEQAPAAVTAPAIVTQIEAPAVETADAAQAVEPAGESVALSTTGTGPEAAPDITRELETATQTPVLPEAKIGKWVINLSSYTRKSTAERMLAVFKQKGIDAEVFSTVINDKPMHRIRVAGFQSARSAKAEIPAIEQTLGLESAWVSRR